MNDHRRLSPFIAEGGMRYLAPFVLDGMLYGADATVADFICRRVPHLQGADLAPRTSLAVVAPDGTMQAGAIFHAYRGHDIEIGAAIADRRACTRRALRTLFAYPFTQLGCARITATTGRRNAPARELLTRLGFKLEGVLRKRLDGKEDAMVYGLLRDECRWIAHG